MATIPSSPKFNKSKAIYRRSTAMSMSPYNYTQQVFSWKGGKLKIAELSLPPMKESDAINWINFLNDCNGFEATFTVDLSKAFPNEAGSNAVVCRLADADTSWDVDEAMKYGISFVVMEVK